MRANAPLRRVVPDALAESAGDGGTFFGFSDPDGNSWAVQQIKARAEKPLAQLLGD